jgi:hypothetical protein
VLCGPPIAEVGATVGFRHDLQIVAVSAELRGVCRLRRSGPPWPLSACRRLLASNILVPRETLDPAVEMTTAAAASTRYFIA